MDDDWEILVGGAITILKNDGVKVSWDDEIPNKWKNEKCSTPPTRLIYVKYMRSCYRYTC
jgi:hypothetical protein